MKEIKMEIGKYLDEVNDMDDDTFLGILAPLKTEEQAKEMLEYLKTVDLKNTLTTPLIDKALDIKHKYQSQTKTA